MLLLMEVMTAMIMTLLLYNYHGDGDGGGSAAANGDYVGDDYDVI